MCMKKTTLADVAAHCGVSIPTVSAVLNGGSGTARFSKEKAQIIRTVAQKLNYRPNRQSRQVRRQRHGNIGVVLSNTFALGHTDAHAMFTEAASQDYLIAIDYWTGSASLPVVLREQVVDGIIIAENIPELKAAAAASGLPVVHYNAGSFGEMNSVNFDEAGAVEQAVALLQDIDFLCPLYLYLNDNIYKEKRFAALQDITNEKCHGLRAETYQNLNPESVRGELRAYLQTHPSINVVITDSHWQAMVVYQVCDELGLQIAQDISVISIGGGKGGEPLWMSPSLTSVGIGHFGGGQSAMRMLIRKIETGRDSPEDLRPYLVNNRESVASSNILSYEKV